MFRGKNNHEKKDIFLKFGIRIVYKCSINSRTTIGKLLIYVLNYIFPNVWVAQVEDLCRKGGQWDKMDFIG